MAKLDPQQNRHYPSKHLTGALHDDFRILYDHVYSLTDRLRETEGKLAEMTRRHGDLATQMANGPSNTRIQGIPIKGIPPTNGQALKYNSATGEIEWT